MPFDVCFLRFLKLFLLKAQLLDISARSQDENDTDYFSRRTSRLAPNLCQSGINNNEETHPGIILASCRSRAPRMGTIDIVAHSARPRQRERSNDISMGRWKEGVAAYLGSGPVGL